MSSPRVGQRLTKTAILSAFWLTLTGMAFALAPSAGRAQRTAAVSGRISLLYQGNRLARDVGHAVVWLETSRPVAATTGTVQIIMEGKAFRPSVVVVTVGSNVSFPNNDPFDHNVFSFAQEARFDLGFYGRGVARSATFRRPGIIRVYCNVHSRMSAFVVVRENPYFTQPSADGSFEIAKVRPGTYTLRAWHERAREHSQEVEVTSSGLGGLDIQLDGRRYRYMRYRNKYGHPYSRRGRRY